MIRLIRNNNLALAVISLALVSCATQRGAEEGASQEQRLERYSARRTSLSQFQSWSLEGKLAITAGKDGGSGRLEWRKYRDSSELDFRGTLGQGAWQLDVHPGKAALALASGERWEAPDVSTLISENLGWDIPVHSLSYWVLGLSAPGEFESRTLDTQGRIEFLSQDGWDIEFNRYREVQTWSLPGKVEARKSDQAVKFVMRSWTPGYDPDGP